MAKVKMGKLWGLVPEIMDLVAEAIAAFANDGRIDTEERARITAKFWAIVDSAR